MTTETRDSFWNQMQSAIMKEREQILNSINTKAFQAKQENINRYAKERAERILDATNRFYAVFLDLEENAPVVKGSPAHSVEKGIDTASGLVILRWGNKLGLTEEEKELIKRYRIKARMPSFINRSKGFPANIVDRDFNQITASIIEPLDTHRQHTSVILSGNMSGHRSSFELSLPAGLTPEVLANPIRQLLRNPNRVNAVLRRAHGYA